MQMNKDMTRKIADVTRRFAKERSYWLDKMSGDIIKSLFPYQAPINEDDNGESRSWQKDVVSFEMTGNLYARLIELSRGSEPTLHIILASLVTILLAKYSGSRDIIIGTPVYKPAHEADYINTVLPLRFKLDATTTFKDLLIQAKDTLLEADKHQNYPIDKLAEELNLSVGDNRMGFPLFDVSMVLGNIQHSDYVRHIPHHVSFTFLKTETYIDSRIDYDVDRYNEAFIRQIQGHLFNLMDTVLFDLDKPFAEINILSKEEEQAILIDFNDTDVPLGKNTLHQLIEQQVERTPENIAIIDANRDSITYKQLDQRADDLASHLIKKGVGCDVIVAVSMERSIDLVVAILGILKAGGAYLPIDPGLPQERIDYMLKDSGACLCLDNESYKVIRSNGSYGTDRTDQLASAVGTGALAYVIYTSGTTGKPKGVALEHRGVVNYITWAASTYVQDETVAFPFYTGIAFDLTVTSIFVPLLTGNTIHIYTGDEGEFLIENVFKDDRIGFVKLTPSHLKLIKNTDPSNIRRFVLGGEDLETQTAKEAYDNWQGNVEIYNEYGPTETVVGSMIHKYDPEVDTGASVSIGKPIANTQIYLLDPDQNPVPVGAPGEIYIGGAGVARGYLNNPGLTNEKFFRHGGTRINTDKAEGMLFRTGDLACRFPDGNIQFLGRIDQQVKVRGFRIELGEIESRLLQYRKKKHSDSILSETIPKAEHIQEVVRCSRCLLSANQPGIRFDSEGVCNVCREYESYEHHVDNYFKTPKDLETLFEHHKENTENKVPGKKYDCLLLFSGGKDSTYALYKLIDMGLKVLTFTFDNGYISASAFDNIRRTTQALNVDHITGSAQNMNPVFVESLSSNHNVCHGCWHALNTYGVKVANDHGINLVVSGLSRGQIFDMRLHPLFLTGVFEEQEIDEKLLFFRKNFHSRENKFSRLLGTQVEEEVVETVRFIDLFRYDNTQVKEIKEYLVSKGWVQPKDTGFCSSNCKINDIGIYIYLKERNCHFYEAPLSWDIRMGQMTRDSGLEEIGFDPQPEPVDQVLRDIGFYDATDIKSAVVLDKLDKNGNKFLCGYIVSDNQLTTLELRRHLSKQLPDYMIPSYFVQVESIPLSASGKVDRIALLNAEVNGRRLSSGKKYVAPSDEQEVLIADLFKELLGVEQVGVDDNFFELGATSFEIVQVSNSLSQHFGQEIAVLKLFEYPSISSFLEFFNEGNQQGAQQEKKEEASWNETMDKGKSRLARRRKMRK
jgi:amino acid adenylation domain-containing protein